MKHFKALSLIIVAFVTMSILSFADDAAKIPSVKIKNLKGETVNTADFNNDGKPFVISFWATWCKPCLTEMETMSEIYADWQEKTGIKIFAVSIDDSRNSKRVAPFVKGKNWPFDVYLDENSDFKRALNVNNPPHTFLCNGKGEIVWQHNGFAPGDEDELLKQIQSLLDTK